MGLFSKSNKDLNTIEADRIAIKHLQEEMAFQIQAIKNIEHEVLKLDGHLRSLRGFVNRMKGNLPEEDIKTSDTDLLKGI